MLDIHHLSLRKRMYQNLEQYPNPDKFKNFFDRFIYFVGIINPLMTLPQIWQIWYYKVGTGVSPISWFAYAFTGIVWVIYGIIHKEKPLIILNGIMIVFDIAIAVGAIIY